MRFVVSIEGLKVDPKKVKAILEWPTPRSGRKVRYFHGLDIFYRKFVKSFSSVCEPLTEIMAEDRKEFKWTTRVDGIFELLKGKVMENIILALLNFNRVFQVEYDASGNAIRVILSQEGSLVAYLRENKMMPK